MKYIKSILLITGLLVSSLLFAGCFDTFDAEFNDDPQVSFAHSVPAGLFSATLNVPVDGSVEYTMRVQLIGPHQSSAVNVNFAADSENSTAVLGEHFSFLQNGSTEIPANSSFGDITVSIDGSAFEAGEQLVLVVEITDADFAVAENYRTFTITLNGV